MSTVTSSYSTATVAAENHFQEMNRFYVSNRELAVGRMSRLRAQLRSMVLPGGMALHDSPSDRIVLIRSALGEITLTDPEDLNFGLSRHGTASGLARMSCGFNVHSFYYTEVVVQTMDELLDILRLHMELQPYQRHRPCNTLYVPNLLQSSLHLPSRYDANHQGWMLLYV
jgi:hypothetical protein